MKDNLSIKNLSRRFKEEEPKFWRLIYKIGIAITAITTGFMTSALAFPDFVPVPERWKPVIFVILGIGGAMTAMSKLTTK